jgi:hypothetical protein
MVVVSGGKTMRSRPAGRKVGVEVAVGEAVALGVTVSDPSGVGVMIVIGMSSWVGRSVGLAVAVGPSCVGVTVGEGGSGFSATGG